jgi:hypothetical protein
VSTTGSQGFLDALNAIRETVVVTSTTTETHTVTEFTALPCQWLIPTPPDGESFDPTLVNVNLVVSEPSRVGYVPTEAACPPDYPAWHYDDPTNPTSIQLCPGTCDYVTNTEQASIQVLFGCTREDVVQ